MEPIRHSLWQSGINVMAGSPTRLRAPCLTIGLMAIAGLALLEPRANVVVRSRQSRRRIVVDSRIGIHQLIKALDHLRHIQGIFDDQAQAQANPVTAPIRHLPQISRLSPVYRF